MKPCKHGLTLLFTFLLTVAVQATALAAWVELTYDREVPPQTRTNVQRAVDTTADLLTQYKLFLPQTITVVVTADTESYTQAIMFYTQMPRAKAETTAQNTAGLSLGGKPVILLRGTLALQNSAVEVFRVLPHEIFHQVQRQYGHTNTVNWLKEGTPEVFQLVARETAGLGPAIDGIRQAEQIIRRAPVLPDARQLASYDYKTWETMMPKYPIYQMSVVMAYKLIQDNGFENVVFFYQLLHNGTQVDKAFIAAFRVPMSYFLAEMNDYFDKLRK